MCIRDRYQRRVRGPLFSSFRKMNLLFSSVVLFTLLVSLTIGTTTFRVSHQVSNEADVAIDVRVDGQPIEAFTDIAYSQASPYADFPDREQYLLSVYVSGTDVLLFNTTSEFTSNAVSSFFVAQNPDLELEGLVYLEQDQDPSEYFANYRVINLATTTDSVSFSVDDQYVDTLGFDQESSTQTLSAAIYAFTLVNSTDEVILLTYEFTFESGVEYTVIINFLPPTTEYQLYLLVNQKNIYDTCQIRGINSVPSPDAVTLQIVREEVVTWEAALDYSDVPEYQNLATGLYSLRFLNASQTIMASIPFACESSGRYSLVIAGDESFGEDYEAEVIVDANYAPLYSQSAIRVIFLSPSPSASPAELIIEGLSMGVISFPDSSEYTITTVIDGVSVVLETDNLILVNDTDDLEFGTSFSLFVFGLLDSDQGGDVYPIDTRTLR
eukprot:TRINITY_DN1742_c0_g1_i2.p1 TRINITY_DN1742_c0_g1~~TRINITY_DN1742_c0_g1_i2.p1  ORF type:complete len:439 (-),score=102.91 TRINITY_DN1742_c0_g1_i2:28-1344(-)